MVMMVTVMVMTFLPEQFPFFIEACIDRLIHLLFSRVSCGMQTLFMESEIGVYAAGVL